MDLTTEAIRLGINMARLRAEVASENIAHVDVADYRTQRADFGDALGLLKHVALNSNGDEQQLEALTPTALRQTVHAADQDADMPVRLDAEVAELESANVDFQSLTTVMSRRFALMQLAMSGRN